MEQAKAAVADFMAKAGHHDTTVYERVAPAIYHETITREDHEDTQTVYDREIHQDHYHFTLQPVEDEEVTEDKVEFNMLPVDQKVFAHGDPSDVENAISQEAAKFTTEIVRVDGNKTSSTSPPIVGEHFHHHVHETIQPIINKRTLEPHVIHTTIPIREVHHNQSIFHATSSLPQLSMADFKRQGGALNGREERIDSFEGEPRSVGKAIGGTPDK
ncbi:Hypothetical predicted protein [Lecanosticta acicola]|uniref:Allergen n=1 Tax=Lecanosticta acicola TaxID=111012 RepID=A0AAI8Z105_9PEZI|nr:Hypothetical predicted protein [Lecanosticta acicola]